MTVNISFLILLLSIPLSALAGERLQGISGSMGKSNNLFSTLFDDVLQKADVDTTDKPQDEEIIVEKKLEAEHGAAKIKDIKQHRGIKVDSTSLAPVQERKSADTFTEIDIISNINSQFEDTINKLQAAEGKPKPRKTHKRPTQLFTNDSVTMQTTDKGTSLHAANETAAIQATDEDCLREKVYSLNVEHAAQYKRLEDFPFTYECVIQR